MTSFDLPAVEAIAAAVHPDFPEATEVFAERMRLYPDGVRFLEVGGQPAGYLIAHPWGASDFPALDVLIGRLPAAADTFYLHDLALLPPARGIGAAGSIVRRILSLAAEAGFDQAALVAVNGSIPFWQRLGFAVADIAPLASRLEQYEPSARYMTQRLDAARLAFGALRD